MNKSKHAFESLLILLVVILSIPAVSESNNIIPRASSISLLSTISLDPTSGPVGTTVTVTGTLFFPNSDVTVSYDGTAVATNPSTITTDLAGGFTATFTVPTSTAGSHTVEAKDTASDSASAQFTVTSNATPPSAPTNLSATAVSSSQINLIWTAPANNGGSPITGYMIERSTDGGATWSTIVPNTGTAATTYSNTGLSPSTTYTYRVSAINGIGTSSPSNTASATTSGVSATPPSAPQNLQATGGTSSVTLSWQAPGNNGGSPITNYKIYRSSSSGTEGFLTTVGNVTSYTDSGLASGHTYFYKITAVNAIGTSHQSNEASATTFNIPSAPQNLQATGGSSSVALSWSAPGNNGGSAITNYKVYRSSSSGTEGYLLTIVNVT